MTTILITNDDGIYSPGLEALQEALQPLGTTIVIAPERDNSAVSHSLTMHRPLKVQQLDEQMYSVDGTPTDCVAIGLKKILSQQPDLLVSGINAGANLGDDISYSGTVSAAIEATMYGIPSIAISVGGKLPLNFGGAMQVAACMAKKVLANQLPDKTLLNINVPSGASYNKIRITRQGRRLWQDSIQETLDPWGNKRYWIGGGTTLADPQQDTDVHVFASGNVSITPIQLDLTNHSGIEFLQNTWRLENKD
ncbi:MAG: 5'-nucleotidase [Desulforhopalus sp.]|jgi:5'-nucleotidase